MQRQDEENQRRGMGVVDRPGRLARLADLAYRRRGRMLLAWVAVTGAVVAVAPRLAGDFSSEFTTAGSESQAAADLIAERFPGISGDTSAGGLERLGQPDGAHEILLTRDLEVARAHVEVVRLDGLEHLVEREVVLAQRFRADWVVTHLFGRSPSVSIKELKRVGFPLRKVVAMVWGAAEADVEAAGGWALAEGYNAMQFAGVGSDYPVLNEIRALYKKEGQEPPKEMNSTVYYNRGMLIAALHVEAIRNAVKMKKSGNITGEDAKKGFEQIANFTLGGLVPPLKITPQDHEGGGVVQIFQVKGGKFVKATDWFSAYPDVVAKHIKDSAKK